VQVGRPQALMSQQGVMAEAGVPCHSGGILCHEGAASGCCSGGVLV
jgi:hypothetical protein